MRKFLLYYSHTLTEAYMWSVKNAKNVVRLFYFLPLAQTYKSISLLTFTWYSVLRISGTVLGGRFFHHISGGPTWAEWRISGQYKYNAYYYWFINIELCIMLIVTLCAILSPSKSLSYKSSKNSKKGPISSTIYLFYIYMHQVWVKILELIRLLS